MFTLSELQYLLLFQRFSRREWMRSANPAIVEECYRLGDKIESLIESERQKTSPEIESEPIVIQRRQRVH